MDRTLSDAAATFGTFTLYPARRQLFDGGEPVRLGSRALELLCALVEAGGAVLGRDELVARVWPKTFVEETSLRVHIAALRRALGDGRNGRRYVVNVVGRGYALVSPVRWHADGGAPTAPRAAARGVGKLPVRNARVLGREKVVSALSQRIMQRRLVSIVGPGGIGKTTVALVVAADRHGAFSDGSFFVDLAPVATPEDATAALLSVLVAAVPEHAPIGSMQALCEALRERELLVVLDNCEHLVGAVAALADALLRATRRVHILATSREPLNVDGEAVHRLQGLASPRSHEGIEPEQALRFAAVQLFVERAAAGGAFVLTDANLVQVLQLCHRLDGAPLPIELAAGRADASGVPDVLQEMAAHHSLLARGPHASRHRTLAAMLDWSYRLLTPQEQRVLCALATFRREFSLESACTVAADAAGCPPGRPVVECLLDLVAKSLINSEHRGDAMGYRLLEVTKAYAGARLAESGFEPAVRARHAEHARDRYTRAEADWDAMPRDRWMALYADGVDDVRAALAWSYGAHGAASVGIALATVAVLPLYEAGLLLLDEYHRHVQNALDRLPSAERADPLWELRLNAALCLRSWDEQRQSHVRTAVAQRTLALAASCADARSRIAALYAVWVSAFTAGDYPLATGAADELSMRAHDAADAPAMLLADRLLSITRHFMGDHEAGWALAQRVLEHGPLRMPAAYSSPVPHEVLMTVVQARILWLRGCADQAAARAAKAVDLALVSHPIAQSQALAVGAIPIALWRGDIEAARPLIEQLRQSASRHASRYWLSYADSYEAIRAARASARTFEELEHGLSTSLAGVSNAMELDHLATVCAVPVSDTGLARVARADVAWCAPEVLRVQGERERRQRTREGRVAAERLFAQALIEARRQGARAWELRAATSMVRLRREHGSAQEAVRALARCLEHFSEGLGTADVAAAHALLAGAACEM